MSIENCLFYCLAKGFIGMISVKLESTPFEERMVFVETEDVVTGGEVQ